MTILAAEASGARMQFAAIAVLDAAPDPDAMRVLVTSRLDAVPRLRQRLVRVPHGRPVWIADSAFDPSQHLESIACPPPGDRRAMLAVAARIVEQRLSLARPPWRIVHVGGLNPASAGGRSALVIVLHHVLADGLAGLAILSRLVDGAESAARPAVPADPWSGGRGSAGRRWTGPAARLRAGAAELLRDGTRGAPPCSINAGPIGPHRALGVARADLGPLAAAAKAAGGTVNDVALTAVTGALHDLLAERGEPLDRLVVSMPVAARRRPAEAGDLGNRTGVLPVSLPLNGAPRQRLSAVADITRVRKTDIPGASAALYGPFARALAALGAFGWFIGHQRLVNTFVTNVRGPSEPLVFGRNRITELVPVSPISGNVGVGFAVLSYAGRLSITVVADADRCLDVDRLAALVRAQLDELAAPPARMAGTARSPGTNSQSGPARPGGTRRP